MKRLSVLAMAMIVMASCAKENVQPNNEPTGEKALLEIGLASTKTQLGEEDKVNNLFPIVWSDGDEIAVIENMGVEGKQNVSVYRLKEGAGTTNGVFEHVSGDAFPKVITDVVYPASAVMPKGTLISNIPIKDAASLIPAKDATQEYAENSFDPKSPIMYFHRETTSEQIVLKPASSIVCIPIIGADDNDYVTSVVWQHMDGDKRTVTLKCPEKGVKLSATDPVNFYLSIRPMEKSYATCNAIVYVHLKNGAVQVRSFRTKGNYAAGTLHRFTPWKLGKKAKWSILAQGSERDNDTYKGVPYGPAKYMIDGNDLSWWESRRQLNATKDGAKMAGPHTVVIDLGSVQKINGIKIKSKETEDKKEPKYGITYTKNGETLDIYGTQSYNPPHTFHIGFTANDPGEAAINAFTKNKTWPTGMTYTTFKSESANRIDYYYGADKKTWWDNKIIPSISARYVLIHFQYAWNNDGNGTAAPFEKIAELDIY
ncbi:MAG: hypothetical protein MR502_03455 [Bacteroides sp.]|nr:hypothetical protein [Bacteroides sp.]MDY5494820.1 hypothetical protein [Candidatus Cryptobacteroides sp.]